MKKNLMYVLRALVWKYFSKITNILTDFYISHAIVSKLSQNGILTNVLSALINQTNLYTTI